MSKITKKKRIIRVRKEKIALLEDQIKDFLQTIENSKTLKKGSYKKHTERNEKMANFWFATGLRVSEMANIQPHWIEKGDKTDYINVQKNSKPFAFMPKYGSTRRIPIPKKMTQMLMRYLAGRTTGYLFMPQTSKSYARFNTKYLIGMFNKYFESTKSIGRKLGSHTFRRTFASQLATSNPTVPLPKISYYLGHSKIQTTISYLQKIRTDDHKEIISADYIKKLIEMM